LSRKISDEFQQQHVPQLSAEAVVQTADTNWTCVGVGYIDTDNQVDLLWRHKTNGSNAVWFMSGISFQTSTTLDTQANNWKVGGLGDSKLDTDGDGLPDLWERNYFGTLSQGANDDYDGDGWTNLQEYQNGTDPTSADLSVLINEPGAASPVP
jgi:Bacterial TSP3 repeat